MVFALGWGRGCGGGVCRRRVCGFKSYRGIYSIEPVKIRGRVSQAGVAPVPKLLGTFLNFWKRILTPSAGVAGVSVVFGWGRRR